MSVKDSLSYLGKGKLFPDYSRPTQANLTHQEKYSNNIGKPVTLDQFFGEVVDRVGPIPALMMIMPFALSTLPGYGSMGVGMEVGGHHGWVESIGPVIPRDISMGTFVNVAPDYGVGSIGKVQITDPASPRNTSIRELVAQQLTKMGYDPTKALIVNLEVMSNANQRAHSEGRAPQFREGSANLIIVGAEDLNDNDPSPDFFVVGHKSPDGSLEAANISSSEGLVMAQLVQSKDGFGIPTKEANDGIMEILNVEGSQYSTASVKLVKPDGAEIDAIQYSEPGIANAESLVDGGNIFSAATPVVEAEFTLPDDLKINKDGSYTLTLGNGEIIELDSSKVKIVNGQVVILEDGLYMGNEGWLMTPERMWIEEVKEWGLDMEDYSERKDVDGNLAVVKKSTGEVAYWVDEKGVGYWNLQVMRKMIVETQVIEKMCESTDAVGVKGQSIPPKVNGESFWKNYFYPFVKNAKADMAKQSYPYGLTTTYDYLGGPKNCWATEFSTSLGKLGDDMPETKIYWRSENNKGKLLSELVFSPKAKSIVLKSE